MDTQPQLIKCPVCKGDVSTNAKNCPHCGDPNPSEFLNNENQSTQEPPSSPHITPDVKKNWNALIGLLLGIASVFLWEIGIIPILAIIFSVIGLFQWKRGKLWQSIVGLILGLIYFLASAVHYGHIGANDSQVNSWTTQNPTSSPRKTTRAQSETENQYQEMLERGRRSMDEAKIDWEKGKPEREKQIQEMRDAAKKFRESLKKGNP